MEYREQYGIFKELVETGKQYIKTVDITDNNVDTMFDNIIAILSDGIDTEFVQQMKLTIEFANGPVVKLSIMDFLFNLLLWSLITCSDTKIQSRHLYFPDAVTKNSIKQYIDKNFIKINMKRFDIMRLNQLIDRSIFKFRALTNFQLYLANTVNLKDLIDLMREYPEFADTVNFDASTIPLEDIKDKGMEAMNTQVRYITHSDHCLKDAFQVGEGVNKKQWKEVAVNIGSKPNGLGSVFPHAIQHSYINGGLKTPEEIVVDSSVGRVAQILKKQNVGDSGAFARKLGINSTDSRLHPDPTYSCDTKNYQMVTIKNSDILEMFNLRYYKHDPDGPLYLLDSDKDRHLIGETLYFRSPMTCASAARGEGICYCCYGDLGYVNKDINIGQIASELLSAIYTQILLSAKHLLESAIVKLDWTGPFYELFNVQFNLIELKDSSACKGIKIVIDPDDIVDLESDDDEDEAVTITGSKMYITQFDIIYPDNSVQTIGTANYDELFLHTDLINYMTAEGTNDDGIYELELSKMKDMSLFEIDIKNNELSKTMKTIMNIIDNKKSTGSYNRNTILQAFIDNNLMGGIKLNSVHFEVILMNQIRHAEDILLKPNWRNRNEPCHILTLNEALNNNPSVSVRMQASDLSRTLTNPANRKLNQPSIFDLYAMERPQDYMSDQIKLSEYTMIDEGAPKTNNPIYFFTTEGTTDGGSDEDDEDEE